MITVGTNSFGYNQTRNFVGLPFKDVIFKKTYDLYKVPANLSFRIFNKVVPRFINRYNDFGLNKVDLYHFFNTITPVKKPWVVTFETTLPRLDPGFTNGYRWLSDKYCRKIIALTNRAVIAQTAQLERYPEYKKAILEKTLVIPPSQQLVSYRPSIRSASDPVVITFVGSAFYRKGGWELLKAFSSLRENHHLHLNIVSRMETEGFMDQHATTELINDTKKMISANPHITYYENLSNREVIELFKKSDIGILPSYAETYGYSVLEAMACGCAVITTAISPFNEFVKDDWGWMIKVPCRVQNGIEVADITSSNAANDNFSKSLVSGMAALFSALNDMRGEINMRRANAIEVIRVNHDPKDRARLLTDIYKASLAN